MCVHILALGGIQLLCRDHTQRLGCGKDDGEEIIRHPFFAGIDFDKLLNKVYQPPFKPKVVRLAPRPWRVGAWHSPG